MSTRTSPLKQAWYKWKALRWIPWRKRFLVGLDLQGNTFWEFHDALSHKHRMRRIVQYPAATHYSEVKISPQWHQWLRHTRSDPPSLTEQSQDLVRQDNLKVLAAAADARWASKPSVLDAPKQARAQPLGALGTGQDTKSAPDKGIQRQRVERKDPTTASTQPKVDTPKMQVPNGIRHHFNDSSVEGEQIQKNASERKVDPWKQAYGGPSEKWQPKPWDGNFEAPRQ